MNCSSLPPTTNSRDTPAEFSSTKGCPLRWRTGANEGNYHFYRNIVGVDQDILAALNLGREFRQDAGPALDSSDSSPPPDIGSGETDLKTKSLPCFINDAISFGVDTNRHFLAGNIDQGPKPALRKDVEEHGEGKPIGKNWRLGAYDRNTGKCVHSNNGEKLLLNMSQNFLKEV